MNQNIDFRIGSTSYIYPADILTNVEKLCRSVDDIELVLFELGSLKQLSADLKDEIKGLRQGVEKQNGRIGALEKSRSYFKGGFAVITLVIIPVALKAVYEWITH